MGEWWRSLFPEGWAEALALVFDPETTAAQVDGIERLLELAPGARVLDVPCGNGRMTFPLAEQGYRTTGVDFTQAFLADARGRALDAGVEVEFVERDMRELPWTDEFDGAFCYGGSSGTSTMPGTSGSCVQWRFVREGAVIAQNRSVVRMYTYREPAAIFDEAGFTDLEAFEATTEKPLRLGSDRALFRARARS